jgi:nucleoside-diphosphate-sugar epimerase
VSKWQAELRAQEAINPQESSLTILRFATMYGEADRGNVGRLIRVVHRGRFLWPGHGTNRKSLIFREDAARACLLALEYERLGVEIYNVSALPVSLREIVTAICDALHMPIPKLGMPQAWLNVALWLAEKLGSQGTLSKTLHKITHDDCYDSSWFNRDYGFCPRISLAEGMKRAVAQLRD